MSDALDAVILAGGKSERLAGVVPPHHKPFLVVNGESLLVAAIEHARAAGAQRIIVVCVGENALPVWQLIGHLTGVRVMLMNGGPAYALMRGLEMCTQSRVLVLMSDNVHVRSEVLHLCAHRYAVGVRYVPYQEALRFTRVENSRWIEQRTKSPDIPDDEETCVWCGPLVIDRAAALRFFDDCPLDEKIGPYLSDIAPLHELVLVSSRDIGIPAEATRATEVNVL
jgi:molybdopterin-guanine dinucleotide biosynthesis protein A